ncbi:MAG: glycosyltransferase [Planctomycetota bacterium]
MKILLVAHGYPPELVGGTETSVEGLALGLVDAGHEVVVVAGSMKFEDGFRVSRAEHGGVHVVRIHRADLFFDHWQKSHAHDVSAAFAGVLAEERPDLVHVHHWIRLSDDLVACAARAGIPACVTLHDLWTTCLIAFRVRPDTQAFCEVPLAPSPCLACAAQVPPATPWLGQDAETATLERRRAALIGELTLARAVVAPTLAHARAVGRYLDLGADDVRLRVVPHGRDLTPRDLGAEQRTVLAPPGAGRPLVLGSWGHLHPLKGPDLLVEAVRRAGPGIELHLAGGEVLPEFADELRRAAAGLAVTVHGAFRLEELGRHPVTAVHAFVSGSRAHESWGLVVDEARALGLPQVLPARGAFPERLREGAGATFYAPGDAEDLARVLIALRDEPGRLDALERAAPPLGELVPGRRQHVEALLTVYDEVLAAGPPAPPPASDAQAAHARRDAWDRALASGGAPPPAAGPAHEDA